MSSSGPQSIWQPKEILRFVRSVPSSTGVAVVITDVGEGYLKAIGNPEGEHVLACEWVATHLARWFGLPTFDFSLIDVTDVDEIWLPNGDMAKPGPAFITRAEKGGTWGGKSRELKRLANMSDISRLVVFDTWIRNRDRYCPPAEWAVAARQCFPEHRGAAGKTAPAGDGPHALFCPWRRIDGENISYRPGPGFCSIRPFSSVPRVLG